MSLEKITLNKGEAVFIKEAFDDKMYRIVEGKIGIFKSKEMNDEDKIDELGAQEFFGEMAMIQRLPRSVSAFAVEDGTVLQLIHEDDYATILSNPEDAKILVDRLSNVVHKVTLDYIEACQKVTELADVCATTKIDKGMLNFIKRCRDVSNAVDTLQENRVK